MIENREEFCNELCKLLQMTDCAGNPLKNRLKELRVIKNEYGDAVRPIFEDGVGKDGYYDVNIEGSSNIGILCSVVELFVRRMW